MSVKLADGPVVRTLLAQDSTERLTVGQPVQACLVEVGRTEAGDAIVDLRFSPKH